MSWHRIEECPKNGSYLIKGDDPPEHLRENRPADAGQLRVGIRHNGTVGVQVSQTFWKCSVTGEVIFPTHFRQIPA